MNGDLPWNLALIWALVFFLLVGVGSAVAVSSFKKWHVKRYLRIPASRIDPAYSTGQFAVPFAMRDQK